jgi:serine/threonine protein kinase
MKKCPSCGAISISSATGNLCPACLLRLGLETTGDESADREIAGRFRLLAPIGRGPHATVYLAQTGQAPRGFITVKLVHQPLDVDHFIAQVRELAARIMSCARVASLTFPEAGAIDDSHAFVVARYVPGMPADSYFRSESGQRADRLSVIAGLCRLVSDIHRSGIVHGAIKSSNVIVTSGPDGPAPVLLDAGLGPAIESSRPGSTSIERDSRHMPDRRNDIASLRRLTADLFASHRALRGWQESIAALGEREYETASDLAEDAAALASRGAQ